MKVPFAVIILIGSTAVLWAAGIDVPLTIRETAGIDRFQHPVTSGIPLPLGALRSSEKLQIMDIHGRFIPAQFFVANRWWKDGSIQWVQFDFAADVPANGKATYFLREVEHIPEFPSPIGLIPRGKSLEVITGPLRFMIGGESNQLLDQVWVDENWGYDFSDRTKILESGNFDLVLINQNRTFRPSYWTQNRIEVEEANALRAVIKISGSFATAEQKEKSLDYVARITVYGGKTYIKLTFIIINRQGNSMTDSLRLDDLSLQVKLDLAREQQRFVFGGAQEDHPGNFAEKSFASLYQKSSDHYLLSGALEGSGAAKSVKPINLGWADLSDDQHGLAISTRWFWQLYPKAYEVTNDGTITLRLFPKQAPPQNIALGAAKTHELLFYFHGKRDFASGQVRNVLVGFQKPIYGLASPKWYCRDTQALGRLPESSESAYKPEYWPLVQKYDEWLVRSRDAVVALRDQVYRFSNQELDEYGVFNFGDAIHRVKEKGKAPNQGLFWENLDYDFPHALYLHFFRTGDLKSLEIAEESLAHLRDVDISHYELDPRLIGGNRTSPALNHWMSDSNKTPEGAHTWESYKNESLFDSFLLTGNRSALEIAKLSVEHALRHNGLDIAHHSRSIGNALFALLKGYEVFGEKRFRDRAEWVVDSVHAWQDGDRNALRQLNSLVSETWSEKFRDGYGEDFWMYGPAWEALKQYYELTGWKDVPSYLQRSVDLAWRRISESTSDTSRHPHFQEFAITLSPGLAAIYEYTGNQKYWDWALEAFKSQAGAGATIECLDLFAQYFRPSQRFLWYLSKEFSKPQKHEVSLRVLRPVVAPQS